MDDITPELQRQPARGALLFSCNGRGAHLYGEPDHDSRVVAETTGAIPTAGFFCNGEIGPIGTSTFLHGFTASIGIFREKA
jgi:small ligand-binding sensory domain FIST